MNKVILVGASRSLLTNKLGKIIDSYDIVCRMNNGGRLNEFNNEYKEIIGSKKNIWLCKHIACFNMFPNHEYDTLVGFGQLSDETIRKQSNIVINATKKGAETISKCIKVLNEFNNYNSKPSCGILSIFYLLDKYNKIHICGMDAFKGGHWYGNKFIKQQETSDKMAASGLGAHNVLKEKEYINYLISKNKIKIIDE